MTCPGGGRIQPTTGYWAPGELSGLVVKCVPALKCQGDNGEGGCASGYQGFACSECSDGYYYENGYCIPCSSATARALLIVSDVVFLAGPPPFFFFFYIFFIFSLLLCGRVHGC